MLTRIFDAPIFGNRPLRARCAALLVALATLPFAVPSDDDRDPASWVDPFIGTGGHGHTYPGATLPFGMVQLSPDTRLTGWDGCSGYHYTDDVVYGFSHTHQSGTGVSDYGDILLMPMTGAPHIENGAEEGPDQGYASRFSKKAERAAPGWYAVTLDDYDIDVELTATERTGIHRYVFPPGRDGHVIVDLAHRDEVIDSELRIVGDREIAGHRRSSAWATDQVVYFVARFSRPFSSGTIHSNLEPVDGTRASGRDLRGVLSFGDPGGELVVQVGISAVDLEGARRNLDAEEADGAFDDAREAARAIWNDTLGRISISGGTNAERTNFYSGLYHSFLAPNLFSDVDGRYRGMDREIHRAEGRRHYTVFSLWDTFRATHPLFTIVEPTRTREFVETFLAQYAQGGRLPVWELAGNETDCMIGYHSVSVIADAHAKGIDGFDESLALEAMVDSATRDHFGLDAYKSQGFIGSMDEHESISKTLEYAYDDWCIARMAEAVGRDDVAARFYERSEGWKHVYDDATGFFRPRVNQSWVEPFDPYRVDNNFTEANAWQYSMFVPHDVEGLIAAHGGDALFVERLDRIFDAEAETTGRTQPDITGLIGQYAHGNEPSHHMAWLYHYAGRPDRSAERVRQILDELYSPQPDGLSGNEDCGQMSSWYVLSALGLYPVAPGTDEYLVGTPLFDGATLRLESGATTTFTTAGEGGYVAGVTVNGEPLDRSYLRHGEIVSGGEIEITLAKEPSASWGRSGSARPRSSGSPDGSPEVVPAPVVSRGDAVFRDSTVVELSSNVTGSEIVYTVTGDEWLTYDAPLPLTESTSIRFKARVGVRESPELRAEFHAIPHGWQVENRSTPLSQYTAGGDLALIDGRRGPLEWRAGGWQGYQGTDFDAVIDLGTARRVRGAGAGFLRDVKSWIWLPASLVVEVSTDGVDFDEVARLENELPMSDYTISIEDFVTRFDPVEARFVRIRGVSAGPIPAWHLGHGSETILFVDELFVKFDSD